MKRLVFLTGVGVGYLVGTPSGRRQLEKFRGWASDVWADPRVQSHVQDYEAQAAAFAKQQGAALWEKAVDTAKGAVSGSASGSAGSAPYGSAQGGSTTGRPGAPADEPLLDADDANPGTR